MIDKKLVDDIIERHEKAFRALSDFQTFHCPLCDSLVIPNKHKCTEEMAFRDERTGQDICGACFIKSLSP